MKRFFATTIVFCLALAFGGLASHALSPEPDPQKKSISEGVWEGNLAIRKVAPAGAAGIGGQDGEEGQGSLASSLKLKILAKGQGALMDIPEQSMFGYPLDDVSWSEGRIHFALDALGPDEELIFEGFYASATGGAIIGTAKSASWKGSFKLAKTAAAPNRNETLLSVPAEDGMLPGTLLLPESSQPQVPLVLLLAGAGTTDRNGNNYNVPGKSDSLAKLAGALAAKGVASYRYDKRGSGESYMLERHGVAASLTEHVVDAVRALKLIGGMDGFSRIVVAGMNEGAWVGAAAANLLSMEGFVIDGLLVLDSSGREPLEDLRTSLGELDEATRAEAEAIVEALLAGKSFPAPSGALSDFFASSRLGWLASWLKFSPAAEIAKVKAPVLFIYGSADLQVPRAAFERLLDARPGAAARVIPSMNYALKQVNTEKENYDSFTNPAYPLPQTLVDLVAAFAKAKPAPAGSLPYDKIQGD